nr:restriction endonuclease subunit S [Mesobacillus maritimus]
MQTEHLGELTDIRTGPFGSSLHAKDYVEDGIPIITTEHFKEGYLPSEKEGIPQVSYQDYLRLNAYELQSGDIVFSRVGSVDINALTTNVQEGWLFSGRVLRVRPQEQLSSVYLHYLLETKRVKQDVVSRAVGQTMPSINTDILNKTMIIKTNSSQEQQKIGEFFKVLDKRIANQERKITKVKALKSAYLTEMFPQEGENVPKRKFKDCSTQWKVCKLGSLYSSIESGNRLPKTMLQEGEVPYVIAKTTNNGILMHIDQHSLDYHGNKMKLFPAGSITFSIDNPEAIFLQKSSFFTSNIMRVLYNEKYNVYHSTFILESIKKLTNNYNWSFKFSGPVVMNSSILVPMDDQGEINWCEIEKIGKLLTNLEKQITIEKCMLEKLKEMKEAYLEEMFV